MPDAPGTVVRVEGPAPYDVRIGAGVLAELPGLVAGTGVSTLTRAAIVHPASVSGLARHCAQLLADAGVSVLMMPVPDAEAAKTAVVAMQCWDALGTAGFTRSDWVIGVGGGATTDLAGFVAATWLRGVRFLGVPTSLLGMVDAAVGGKTGINTAAGKNLVGAFHEPAAVLCDLDVLAQLPDEEYRTGLAEVIKCGFIADPVILDLIEADVVAASRFDPRVSAELVRRSVEIKARVVSGDLTEIGTGGGLGREVLNYGHTLGHAVERREHFGWRHGHAVSVGLVYVAELARASGLLDDATADRHARILGGVGLPTTYPASAWTELAAGMRLDKKTRGDTLRFVVLHGLADPALLEGPAPGLLEAAYGAVAS
ncbi:MAG TPA: 3-dehydroquinate synthase [Actinopolymorphaceae bacterium]|jgi:3-dehydroquinate synthase